MCSCSRSVRSCGNLCGGVLSLIGLLLWVTFYMECKRMRRRWLLDYLPSLLTTFLISFGAACIQSSALIPRSNGGRLIYFALFLISFIMYNYYTSVVVSSLLSSPVKSKIKTMQQLAESQLTVGLEPLPFTKSYLNYSRRSDIHLFIKRKIESQSKNPDLWLPAEEGVLRVRDNPGYVYVFETSSGYAYVERYFTAQEICDLNEILFRPEQLFYTHLHRNSTYKELFRLRLLRVLETGVYRKQRSYWVHMKLHCVAQNFVITVGMEYVAPLLLMLIFGYILVVFILLLELAWQRYLNRTKRLTL
ncbi:GL22748 [Drosophila persimilis]|uniref:Ionotropic receptor 75a n=1 Tax=Drosophila persimilis TaxID=7234 RepID=B4GZQ8_DROPE|nr:GL22748 [Drosophila persimilis]